MRPLSRFPDCPVPADARSSRVVSVADCHTPSELASTYHCTVAAAVEPELFFTVAVNDQLLRLPLFSRLYGTTTLPPVPVRTDVPPAAVHDQSSTTARFAL